MEEWFDAVIFLTSSDWPTEPRSNRYHYATRFAERLPVYFVQPDQAFSAIYEEPSGHPNISLVHCSFEPVYPLDPDKTRGAPVDLWGKLDEYVDTLGQLPETPAQALRAFFRSKGIRRPLIWIYNFQYSDFIISIPDYFKVFHATEDYTIGKESIRYFDDTYRDLVLRSVANCNMMVAVSESVREKYLRATGFGGVAITLPNGCDFSFWKASQAYAYRPSTDAGLIEGDDKAAGAEKVIFYQGGINARLDFDLIDRLINRMPDWTFWFCGRVVWIGLANEGADLWARILAYPNVRYMGEVSPDRLAVLARSAAVGIAPYQNTPLIYVALPLKSYEYLACGLPVVTAPVRALEADPANFTIARSLEEWEAAIRAVSLTRNDPVALARRLGAAEAMDYSRRFRELDQEITQAINANLSKEKILNVLIFYDDAFSHIKTIQEHLTAFSRHSQHKYFFLPVSDTVYWRAFESLGDRWPHAWDLESFDVVIWHYGLPASLEDYISPLAATALAEYSGLKVLFIQDEYENTSTISKWIEAVGIDLVMTCVPEEGLDYVYPEPRRNNVEFIQTLTGFVPEDEDLDRLIVPLEARETRIGYRGRILPYHYGQLGFEKYRIGVEMKARAEGAGVPVDIEVDDSKRIYGRDWYRFLGSVRATLGTESGANVFDFDGSLKTLAAAARQKNDSFADFFEKNLVEKEGVVRMNQISPKFFESIRLRTALICFEGSYSNILEANRHYIPLKKDFSNAQEVLDKLEDLEFLRALTSRAFADVIESGRYSYKSFVSTFDEILSERVLFGPRAEIISAPIAKRRRSEIDFTLVTHQSALEYSLNTGVLGGTLKRADLAAGIASEGYVMRKTRDERPPSEARSAFQALPSAVRAWPAWWAAGTTLTQREDGVAVMTPNLPGQYAAEVGLDFSAVVLDYEYAWLRVLLSDVGNGITVALFEEDTDTVLLEQPAPYGPGPHEVIFPLKNPVSSLLFRAGSEGHHGLATFLGAEILTVPTYARQPGRDQPEPLGRLDLISRRARQFPPEEARIVSRISPQAIEVPQYWREAGAEISQSGDQVRVHTPPIAWHYAAIVHLDIGAIDFQQSRCWLRVGVADLKGAATIALFDFDANEVVVERSIVEGPGVEELLIEIYDARSSSLLVRTGDGDVAASFDFLGGEILVAPRDGGVLVLGRAGGGAAESAKALELAEEPVSGGLASARVTAEISSDSVTATDHWRNAGAQVRRVSEGVRVSTPSIAWHYAAMAPLGLQGLDFERQAYWISIELEDVTGELGVSLFDEEANEIHHEQLVQAGPRQKVLISPAAGHNRAVLMFRSGSVTSPAEATIRRIEILVADRR